MIIKNIKALITLFKMTENLHNRVLTRRQRRVLNKMLQKKQLKENTLRNSLELQEIFRKSEKSFRMSCQPMTISSEEEEYARIYKEVFKMSLVPIHQTPRMQLTEANAKMDFPRYIDRDGKRLVLVYDPRKETFNAMLFSQVSVNDIILWEVMHDGVFDLCQVKSITDDSLIHVEFTSCTFDKSKNAIKLAKQGDM